APALIELATQAIGDGVVGIEPNRLAEVGHGAADVAAVLVKLAARIEGPRAAGISLDRFVEVAQGALGVALAQIDIATIDIGGRAIAIDPDGFVAIGQCAIRILLRPPPSAAAAECSCTVGTSHLGITDDPVARGDALVGLADLSDELALIEVAES